MKVLLIDSDGDLRVAVRLRGPLPLAVSPKPKTTLSPPRTSGDDHAGNAGVEVEYLAGEADCLVQQAHHRQTMAFATRRAAAAARRSLIQAIRG